MGWMKKILKGSGGNVSEQQYHRKSGEDAVLDLECFSDYQIEDGDHAIALCLSVEGQQKAETIDYGSLSEGDERLARVLQRTINIESSPYRTAYVNEPMPFLLSSGFRLCTGCNTEIRDGHFFNCVSAVWHPECFRCHTCNQQISDYEFSMSGNYPYHKSCYEEDYHLKCDVCKQFIPTSMYGFIEYKAHPFWHQKYCPSHESDGTPQCCSCERMEPRDARYISMDDGRKLCLECLDSAIMNRSECQPLFLDIQGFYKSLNMKVTQQIPLLLVERQALNEAMEGEKNGYHHLPETRGLCLSEDQTVRAISRRPIIGARNRITDMIISTILRRPRVTAQDHVTDTIREPYRLRHVSEVTAILILYGLPRLLTGSILVHEMMHAWLRLNGYHTLSQEVEEGICQVLAHMWLDSEIRYGGGSDVALTSSSLAPTSTKMQTRSQFEMKLGGFFKRQIESDRSSAYGDGFRTGYKAVLQYGLRRTLDHIKSTGSFPC